MHRLMRQRHLPAREGEEQGQRLWWQSHLPAPDGRSSSSKSAVVVAYLPAAGGERASMIAMLALQVLIFIIQTAHRGVWVCGNSPLCSRC